MTPLRWQGEVAGSVGRGFNLRADVQIIVSQCFARKVCEPQVGATVPNKLFRHDRGAVEPSGLIRARGVNDVVGVVQGVGGVLIGNAGSCPLSKSYWVKPEVRETRVLEAHQITSYCAYQVPS